MAKKINSKAKGKTGELEFAHFLTDKGLQARRGQQFSGSPDSPDVICEATPDLHWEIKRNETLNIDKALEQSINDAGGLTPVVAHRKNRTVWKVTMLASDFIELYKKANGIQEDRDHD
jgi:Holliday junction resolvase